MKALILAVLLLSSPVTAEDKANISLEELGVLLTGIEQMKSDQRTAKLVLARMQARINELEKMKCL